MRTETTCLKAQGLVKTYAGTSVVCNMSFEVHAGEVVGLLGPNGSGKTTSFYMVVGLVAADAGVIELDGRPITHMPIYKRARLGVSYLPQEASIFRKLTVADNIRAVLQLQRLDSGKPLSIREQDLRLERLLEELQIESIRNTLGLFLSGGERRRVEIARTLACSPKYILLDEPFAGVDPIAVSEIQGIIKFLKVAGIGVLITDHSVRETLTICDRAYIVRSGSVCASGTPLEVLENSDVRRHYLGQGFAL